MDVRRSGAAISWAGIRLGMARLLPMVVVIVPFAFAFGAAAIERGLSPLEAVAMSALVFAGASQFAVLELWSGPLPLLSITVTALAVNSRHLLMGAALSPWLNPLPWPQRSLVLGLMVDLNFADAHRAFREGARDVGIMLGGGILLWLIWQFGTVAGVVVGAGLGELERFGLDLVMASFFAALVTGEVRQGTRIWPLVVAAATALALADALPPGWSIVVAATAGGLVGAWQRVR